MGIFSRVRAANEVIESAKREIDQRRKTDEWFSKRKQKRGAKS